MKAITFIIIGIVFAALGQLLFKLGTNVTGEITASNLLRMINVYIVLGIFFYGLSSVFWIIALSKADLSFVYPFTALTFIIVYVLSILILHESIHTNRLAGSLIIILGIFVLFFFEK